jgi:hypothetical protein
MVNKKEIESEVVSFSVHGLLTCYVLQWTNDGSKVCVCIVVHSIKPLWVIMLHIFTSTNIGV